ncbi:MAG TPA: trehalose-6-phosphate synthase [Ktedonobacteraceae bacterium]
MSKKTQRAASPPTVSEHIHADHVIMVTNRGPVEYYMDQDNTLRYRRGEGGVVTALLEAMPSVDTTWVALAMTEGDRTAVQQAHDGLLPSPLPGQRTQLRYVTVPKGVYHNHYNIISNQVLWFLHHYLFEHSAAFPTFEQILHAWENGYSKANAAIADTVSAEIERNPSSTVVVLHDYHLYLAPTLIRRHHPAIIMQQFIHIPWPEVRYWESHLPTGITQAIYNGLLGNDILGFQTKRDAENFLEGVPALLNDVDVDVEDAAIVRQSHRTLVRDYPISISVAEERRIVHSTAGKRAAQDIRPLLGEQTIMRVDRIEPTKNIVRGFHAYAYLLERHPELYEKVTFLAFLVPSRQGLSIYRKYREEILKLIEDINQKFGRNEWTPIQAFVQNNRTQALAALQFYDVLLVNPLIDGMNLVAKEGPIVNQRNGVLVLSRTSGAFQQMEEGSIPISPADMVETAEALYKALTLSPEERRQKAELARQSVEHHDLKAWITQQACDISSLIAK